MEILAAAWMSYFGSFFLAAVGCAALSRRGSLPLHISAITGVGAYVFVSLAGQGWMPLLAAAASLLGAVTFAVLTGLFFARVNGASASLGAIAIQLLFDQYVRSVAWTGRSSGLWEGIPITSSLERLSIAAGLLLGCVLLYRAFEATAAARLLVLDGQSPVLSAALGHAPNSSMLVAGLVCGLCAGAAGILAALQTGIVAPAGFSLHRGLLYVSRLLKNHSRLEGIEVIDSK